MEREEVNLMAEEQHTTCPRCRGIVWRNHPDTVNAVRLEHVQTLDGMAETVSSAPIYWFHGECFPVGSRHWAIA